MFKEEGNWVLYICLIAIVGSSALYAETGDGISAGILAGSTVMFIAIIVDFGVNRICTAVKEQKMHESDVQIIEVAAAAAAKAAYQGIAELQKKS
jgi:hypothetical protein